MATASETPSSSLRHSARSTLNPDRQTARPLQPSLVLNAAPQAMTDAISGLDAQATSTPGSKFKRFSLLPPSASRPSQAISKPLISDPPRQPNLPVSETDSASAGLAPAFVPGEAGPSRCTEARVVSDSTAEDENGTSRSETRFRNAPIDAERVQDPPSYAPETPRSVRSPIGSMRRKGCRSSILYSPAPREHSIPRRGSTASAALRTGGGQGSGGPVDPDAGAGGSVPTEAIAEGREEDDMDVRRRKGMTLTDRHADLLTAIAHKERRVNELRQELAAQEAALAQLKSKWTSVVSRSTRRPHTTQLPPASSQSTPKAKEDPRSSQSSRSSGLSFSAPDTVAPMSNLLSPSSSTSSRLCLDPVREDLYGESASVSGEASSGDSTWTSMLTQAIGPEGMLLNQQALTEGKRFWGKFVETVSAAAGGTVPLDVVPVAKPESVLPASELSSAVPKLDLTSLRGMMTIPGWSSSSGETPTLAPAPPKPSNSARLANRRAAQARDVPFTPRPKAASSATVSASPVDQDRGRSGNAAGNQRQPSSRFRDLLDGMSDSGEQPTPVKPMTPSRTNIKRAESSKSAAPALRDNEEQSTDEEGWGW